VGAVSFSIDIRLVRDLQQALPLATFVETGTFKGDAVAVVAPYVEHVFTIECSEPLFSAAAKRFASDPRVQVIHGDSPQVLARLVPGLRDASVLYWLDAHWCGAENTAGDHSQCPLLAELAAIGSLGPSSVILIDDARLFLAPPPEPHDTSQWPAFDEIVCGLRALSATHEIAVVNDVIAFFPAAAHEPIRRHGRAHGIDWLHAAQALAEAGTLRAIIEEKEAAIHEQHAARVELVSKLEESHAGIHALEEAAASARELNARLTRELEAKEAVIREQDRALRAYRAAFVFLRPLVRALSWLRPLVRPLSRLRRAGVQAKAILRPRLGVLKQHAPRPLAAPPRQVPRANPAPRISLVTPSYRQAEFIERTLRSVLDQSYPDLEYFVQDGGSDDGTVAILERYADRLAGWESRRDAGQSEALNRGFARTTGDIMGWLNSDDLLLPGALARVADHFHDHPEVDVVYGHRIVIDEDDAEIGRWILPPHDNAVLSWADYVPQETLFWRRRLWDRTGARIDESFRFAMDWDLAVRFREAGARFVRIPQFLGAFRVHRHQKTSGALLENGFREMDRIRERALGRVPRAIAPYLRRHVAADVAWRVARRIGSVTSRTARSAWQRLPTVLLCALVRYP
jgi:GT2 family glycosyltransferase